MNRTVKDATVRRYHYDSHAQLARHLDDFVSAYNFGRRLKRLRGLTPHLITETHPAKASAALIGDVSMPAAFFLSRSTA